MGEGKSSRVPQPSCESFAWLCFLLSCLQSSEFLVSSFLPKKMELGFMPHCHAGREANTHWTSPAQLSAPTVSLHLKSALLAALSWQMRKLRLRRIESLVQSPFSCSLPSLGGPTSNWALTATLWDSWTISNFQSSERWNDLWKVTQLERAAELRFELCSARLSCPCLFHLTTPLLWGQGSMIFLVMKYNAPPKLKLPPLERP